MTPKPRSEDNRRERVARPTESASPRVALGQLIIEGSNAQDPTEEHFPGDDLFAPTERRKGLPIGNLAAIPQQGGLHDTAGRSQSHP